MGRQILANNDREHAPINPQPSIVTRQAFLQGRLQLAGVIPRGHKVMAARPQEKPRQAGQGRARDLVRRRTIQGKIAASPRPLPLRKRIALLAKKCLDAHCRNAAGLVA